jgi:hypothetical protein
MKIYIRVFCLLTCFLIFSYQAFSADIHWNDAFNFKRAESAELLCTEVPAVRGMLSEISGNKQINVCIGEIQIVGLVYPDSIADVVNIGGTSYQTPGKRTYYTSAKYDLTDKVLITHTQNIKRFLGVELLSDQNGDLYENQIEAHLELLDKIHSVDFLFSVDRFTLHDDTQTFDEYRVKELYDYFLDKESDLYKEMLDAFNLCKEAKELYLVKYDAFIEAITESFKLSKISPKLSTTSITNGSNNEEKKYEKHLKVLKGYFMDDEVIKSSRMSMISTFEQYKSAIGTFANKFYHSETRFIADFFRSPLYQVLISYYGEINIRLHTYFNCCARCRSFIADGFYVKLKEDMKDSSSVK